MSRYKCIARLSRHTRHVTQQELGCDARDGIVSNYLSSEVLGSSVPFGDDQVHERTLAMRLGACLSGIHVFARPTPLHLYRALVNENSSTRLVT